jgi:hypothetical protein
MEFTLHQLLHILRNPKWNKDADVARAMQQAADMLEQAYGADRVTLSLTQERATELLRLLAEEPMGAVRVMRGDEYMKDGDTDNVGHPPDPGIKGMRMTDVQREAFMRGDPEWFRK